MLAASLSAASAQAHVGHTILRAERYLKLDASEADTRVVVSLTLGADEGLRVLIDADADGDGEVSQSEADRYLATWAEGLATELPIEVDGAAVHPAWRDGFLDPIGPVRRASVTLEMVAHLTPAGREANIVVTDAMVRRETFERTDVSFRARDGARLVGSGAGTHAGADLAFTPSTMPQQLNAALRFDGRREALSPSIYGALALLAAALSLGLASRWRKRGARSEPRA